MADTARALILGYDGSECAGAALEEAIELAEATGDRIVVAFGYEPGGPGRSFAPTASRCASSESG